jgi:hypothetical protein
MTQKFDLASWFTPEEQSTEEAINSMVDSINKMISLLK